MYVLLSLLVFIFNVFCHVINRNACPVLYVLMVYETLIVISFGEGFSSIVESVCTASLYLINDYSVEDLICCLLYVQ